MMSKTVLLTTLCSFMLGLQLYSQEIQDDVVYMNTGSFLRGTIVEVVPGSYVKIKVGKKDTLTIPYQEIKTITKENRPPVSGNGYDSDLKSSGYTCIVELGFGYGRPGGGNSSSSRPDEYAFLVTVFNGFTINPTLQLGIVTGLNVWKNRIMVPVLADLRVNLMKRVTTPFIYGNAGYSLGWTDITDGTGLGGGTGGVGAGARIRIARKQMILISLGYMYQGRGSGSEGSYGSSGSGSNFIMFKTGLLF
jgi:hypothetical protein